MSSECMLLFPFTCLQFLANRYIWFQYWPVAPDRTHFVMRLYFQSAPSSYREAFAEAHMAAYTRDIVTEDGSMVARQHRSFLSGGLSWTMLGENESVLRHFHQMIQQRLADVTAANAG
jgi:phenylpropionate dioxygenase-like ring-hydroxylating dioxygenase large terminal subunit